VDLDRGVVRVRKQLQRLEGKPQLVDLKTRQSRRTISLPAALIPALRSHRTRQIAERLALGERWQGEAWGLVFTSTIGTPLDPRNLTDRYKALLQAADLPAMRFHDLRHSCASLLIAQRVPMEIVKETLGHSQISLKINTYVHLLPETQRQAADAMDRLFGTA
jgi:integrase